MTTPAPDGLDGGSTPAALAPGEPVAAAWRALGCDVRLLVTDPSALTTARAILAADLATLDLAASRFRSDSEISALARAEGQPMPISPVLVDAISAALLGARISDGDLDPTMGAALAALGYDRTFSELVPAGSLAGPAPAGPAPASPAPASPPPADAAPDGAAAPGGTRVGWGGGLPGPGRQPGCGEPRRGGVCARPAASWADVELDEAAGTVRVPPDVVLDLGATAKARCADLSAARIAAACGCGVLVSLGGDIAVAGPAPTGGWVIRIQDVTGDPDQPAIGSPTCLVAITAGGLATSSTAARRWRHGGSVLHHILDPGTGQPAEDVWRTVSVAASSALLANIASTTAVIRGRAARSWLERLGVQARLVARTPTGAGIVLVGGWPRAEEGERWTA